MSDDKKAPPREDGQDSRKKFGRRLLMALDDLGVQIEDIERAANDNAIMADLTAAFATIMRESAAAKTDSMIESVPTNRIVPANLTVDLQAEPKLVDRQVKAYHCRVPPSWTFDRRQLCLEDPVKRLGMGSSVSGIVVWDRMNKVYGNLLPNANILDVFLMYPLLVPAAWNEKRFYAFGTKIKADGCEWVRGLRQARGAWEQLLERLDRTWIPNDLVLVFKTSE